MELDSTKLELGRVVNRIVGRALLYSRGTNDEDHPSSCACRNSGSGSGNSSGSISGKRVAFRKIRVSRGRVIRDVNCENFERSRGISSFGRTTRPF